MSVVPLRRLDGPCPFEECDGSGFVLDEQTNTAFDCRCRPQRVALAKARHLSAVIPRRYADVAFERPPVTQIDPQVVAATGLLPASNAGPKPPVNVHWPA